MAGKHEAPETKIVLPVGVRAYTKLIVHVALTLAATVNTLIAHGGTPIAWLQVLAQALSIAGLYVASNTVPGAKYAKSVISGASAALAVLIPAIIEGRSAFEGTTLVNMILAVCGVLGVYQFADVDPVGNNVITLAERVRARAA